MEIWRDRRLFLEQLQERKVDNLTAGQARTLSELITEVGVAESGVRINPAKIRKLAHGLYLGQHLEESELLKFINEVSSKKGSTRRQALGGFMATGLLSPERNPTAFLDFREIGPVIAEYNPWEEKSGSSDGVRAFWVDPKNPDFLIAATWEYGVRITGDAGKSWQEDNPYPKLKQKFETARDFVPFPDSSAFVISDYSIGKRGIFGGWEQYFFPTLMFAQTGKFLKNGTLLIGGRGGVLYFKGAADKPGALNNEQNWKLAEGLPTYNMVRALEVDQDNNVYLGGWGGFSNASRMTEGPGFWWSRDNGESFQPHPLADEIRDSRGRLNINSIKAVGYNGRKILLIGGEGGGIGKPERAERPYSPDFRSFFIVVDEKVYDPYKTDVPGLCQALGQDLITPQRGIEVSLRARKIFVSSWSQHIAYCSLDSIVNGEQISWQRITQPLKPEDPTFGAGHLMLATNSKGEEKLFTGGEIYKPTPHRFIPIRRSEL